MRSFFNKKKKAVVETKESVERERTESAAELPPTAKPKGKASVQRRENATGANSKQALDNTQHKVRERDIKSATTQPNSRPPPPPLRTKRSDRYLSESETESYSSETDSDEDHSFDAAGELRQMKPPRERRYTSTSGESESSDESESSYESEAQFIRRDPQLSRPVEVVSLLRQRGSEQETTTTTETVLNQFESELTTAVKDLKAQPLPTVFPTLEDIIVGRNKLATTEDREHERCSRKPASVTSSSTSKGVEKRPERKIEKSAVVGQSKRRPVGKKEDDTVERTASASAQVSTERTSEKPGRLGDGCYLRYDPSHGGTIFAQWSVTGMAPHDALAYFEPKASVSRRKYTKNEGRVDLVKGVGSDSKKYLEAWTYFWLMAREERGFITTTLDMVNQEDLMLDLWTLDYEGNVNSVIPGKGINTSNVDCLAALPRSSQAFEGVDFVTKSFFINVSQRCGMNISFER